jgi:hypothetical protein
MNVTSNLPPGCSSADGGLDHDYEATLEELQDLGLDAVQLRAVVDFARPMKAILDLTYQQGFDDGRMHPQKTGEALEQMEAQAQAIERITARLALCEKAANANTREKHEALKEECQEGVPHEVWQAVGRELANWKDLEIMTRHRDQLQAKVKRLEREQVEMAEALLPALRKLLLEGKVNLT